MKKTFTRIAALLMAVTTAAAFSFGCGKEPAPVIPEDPIEAILASDEASEKAMKETDLGRVFDRIANGGSIELFIDAGPIMRMSGLADADIGAALKLFFADNGQKGAVLFDLLSGNQSLLDAGIFAHGTEVSVTSEALLGNGAYGTDIATLADDIAASEIFAGFPEIDELEEVLDTYSELLASSAELEAQSTAFADKLENDMLNILRKHGDISSVDGKFTVCGNDIATKDVTFSYSGEQLVALASDTMEYLRDSDDIRAYIESFISSFASYGDINSTKIMSEYSAALDQAIEAFKELPAEELADVSVVIKEHISKANSEIIGLSIDVLAEGNTAGIKLVMGPSAADLDELSLSMVMNGETVVDAGYRVTSDSGSEFKSEVYAAANGETRKLAEISYNRGSSEYNLTIGDINSGSTVSLLGTYTANNNTVKIGLSGINAGGVGISLGDTAIVFNASAQLPAFPSEYTNIFKMSREEFMALVEDIAKSAEMLGSLIG